MLSRATEKLALDWPDGPRESKASKLDERFLSGPNSRPSRTPTQVCLPLHDTLIPLSHFIHEWERLPGVSLWVLRTVRSGYTLQLGRSPPRFDRVQLTVVNSTSKASVLQQELSSLLQKGAIEEIPQSDIEQGFFSRYFLVPKRDSGLRPILDLRQSEFFPLQREVQDADDENHHVSDSRRGLVCHYRHKGCIFSHPGQFSDTGGSFGLPLEGRLTNTRSCPSAWPWRREHSRNARMLHWPL